MTRLGVWCGLGILVSLAAGALADEDRAAVTFELLFAPEVRRVRMTTSTTDDVALATDMVKTAMGERDSDMVLLLCRSAYDLGQRTPKGYEPAVAAMETIKSRHPDQAPDCNEKLIALRRKQFYAAPLSSRKAFAFELVKLLTEHADFKAGQNDYKEAARLVRQAVAMASLGKLGPQIELNARLKRWSAAMLVQTQIEQFKAKLRANPKDDLSRRRLVQLLLIERNDPAAASEYLHADSDEILRTYLPLATRAPADLPAEVCSELGTWYLDLSEGASAAAKSAMLTRAKGYFQAYLTRDKTSELGTTRARARLILIEHKLKEAQK